MRFLGALALLVGIVGLLFALTMDTTVASGEIGRRIHNIGLMNDKQNLLLLFATSSVIGAVFLALGGRRSTTNAVLPVVPSPASDLDRTCPFCAETIKMAAVVCRFCQRDLPEPLEKLSPDAPLPLGLKINVSTEAECLATLDAMGYVVTSPRSEAWEVKHSSTAVVAHARSLEQLQSLVLRAAQSRARA